ncbi:DUF4625 domain-containing protein [Flavivirga eckloniae]|nr:DUF4625 domain-containing protein [Flavivirga eckloniae]
MKLKTTYYLLLLVMLPTVSCSSGDSIDKDEQKPTITINYAEGFPQACAELTKGQTYIFRAKVADNKALASYSLDIHNNFDHHTHDDQGIDCNLESTKQAINPLIFMENFSIENNPTSYEIKITLAIPDDVDPGDYHCQYSVTDQTGWHSRTSVDIKIVE